MPPQVVSSNKLQLWLLFKAMAIPSRRGQISGGMAAVSGAERPDLELGEEVLEEMRWRINHKQQMRCTSSLAA